MSSIGLNPFSEQEEKLSPEEQKEQDFKYWLKKKQNYRNFKNKEQAMNAFELDMKQKSEEEEWKRYKKEAGIIR